MTALLTAALAGWMLLCIWCGFAKRFGFFAVALIGGLALCVMYVGTVIETNPLSANAMIGYAAAILYALGSLGLGWIIGRFVRGFRDSKVQD